MYCKKFRFTENQTCVRLNKLHPICYVICYEAFGFNAHKYWKSFGSMFGYVLLPHVENRFPMCKLFSFVTLYGLIHACVQR